ncbi:hypothetical protein VNO80_19166 [Phaseolus coccineus]|uniref:Myosin motor domain-containing protein n=1 Tax=Phaseolus coccineus TaxID=3886 RepID=A0AAN9MF46_PHACN
MTGELFKVQSWLQLPNGDWELVKTITTSRAESVISLPDGKTKARPVLVAVNPFKKVPLYGNDYIEAYKCKAIESPHVYAITDTAFREMIRDEVNQSIIIRSVFLD